MSMSARELGAVDQFLNINFYVISFRNRLYGEGFFFEIVRGERDGDEAVDHSVISRRFMSMRVQR